MQLRAIINKATYALQNNRQHECSNFEESYREAISLVSYALKLGATDIYTNYNKILSPSEKETINKLIARRLKYEPLEYITGKVNFMGLELIIEPPVFIPRPETETLVETLIKLAENKQKPVILDIGTGCGAIAIAALKFLPTAKAYASDIIDLRLAKKNAIKQGVADRINLFRGNLFDPIKIKVDFIVSNPPYIPTREIPILQPEIRLFESHTGIDGGEDGLFFIRKLIRDAPKYLNYKGALLLEISPQQESEVRGEAKKYFKHIEFVKDFTLKPRVLVAQFTQS